LLLFISILVHRRIEIHKDIYSSNLKMRYLRVDRLGFYPIIHRIVKRYDIYNVRRSAC